MKRSHEEIGRKRPPQLGALEFAATLNDDDARAVLSALRRFTKTVRRQRRQALSRDDSETESSSDDESSSEEEEVSGQTQAKKPKKQEAWMEDTEAFNVPFVGTSVAKGDTGTVIPNQWPTGLLQAYLKASPMAVELTSGDLIPPAGHVHKRLLSNKSKQGKKASQTIYRAYLEALAELITAHVPISTLQREMGLETEEHEQSSSTLTKDSLASVILRERLAGIMALINEETGGGKMMDRPLVANALRVLANLSSTSLGAAREVTRALDASLKDGILKSLLRSRKTADSKEKDDKETNTEKRDDLMRIECLRLAAVLAEWQDAAIISYITTKGSRERKINAGILYLTLRLGLHDSAFTGNSGDGGDEDEYLGAVTRLLRVVGLLLPDADSSARRPLMSTRDLVDFFSGDALNHISQIATCAPPLADSDSYRQVLAGSNADMDATPVEEAGIESRRILFVLLADPARSPFLSRMSHSKSDDKLAAHCAQQLVRAMLHLLQHRPSLPIQRFLIHCFLTTPMFVPHFFKLVTVPDSKQTFGFIARMGFLFRLIQDVPPVSSCIESVAHLDAHHVEQIVSCIIPANLKKHILSKALQSSNALIVSETLKLLWAALDRYRIFLADIKAGEEFRNLVADAFLRRLPDMQPLLSVRSRFDPFASEGDLKASTVVIGHVCKVLDSYALCLPDVLNSVKFDWVKLLPANAEVFCSANPILQFQLLQTLESVLALQEVRNESLPCEHMYLRLGLTNLFPRNKLTSIDYPQLLIKWCLKS